MFSGDSATFRASVVNQIGSEGYLDQNFTWKVLNKERTEEAEGFTVVEHVEYIERGYESFEKKLQGIGAIIDKFDESDNRGIQKFRLKCG